MPKAAAATAGLITPPTLKPATQPPPAPAGPVTGSARPPSSAMRRLFAEAAALIPGAADVLKEAAEANPKDAATRMLAAVMAAIAKIEEEEAADAEAPVKEQELPQGAKDGLNEAEKAALLWVYDGVCKNADLVAMSRFGTEAPLGWQLDVARAITRVVARMPLKSQQKVIYQWSIASLKRHIVNLEPPIVNPDGMDPDDMEPSRLSFRQMMQANMHYTDSNTSPACLGSEAAALAVIGWMAEYTKAPEEEGELPQGATAGLNEAEKAVLQWVYDDVCKNEDLVEMAKLGSGAPAGWQLGVARAIARLVARVPLKSQQDEIYNGAIMNLKHHIMIPDGVELSGGSFRRMMRVNDHYMNSTTYPACLGSEAAALAAIDGHEAEKTKEAAKEADKEAEAEADDSSSSEEEADDGHEDDLQYHAGDEEFLDEFCPCRRKHRTVRKHMACALANMACERGCDGHATVADLRACAAEAQAAYEKLQDECDKEDREYARAKAKQAKAKRAKRDEAKAKRAKRDELRARAAEAQADYEKLRDECDTEDRAHERAKAKRAKRDEAASGGGTAA